MAPTRPANGASTGGMNGVEALIPDASDLLYEEELLRNPYSLKLWIRYIDANKAAPLAKRRLLYERALQKLPGSYKVSRSWRSTLVFAGGLPEVQRRGREGFVEACPPCRLANRADSQAVPRTPPPTHLSNAARSCGTRT